MSYCVLCCYFENYKIAYDNVYTFVEFLMKKNYLLSLADYTFLRHKTFNNLIILVRRENSLVHFYIMISIVFRFLKYIISVVI